MPHRLPTDLRTRLVTTAERLALLPEVLYHGLRLSAIPTGRFMIPPPPVSADAPWDIRAREALEHGLATVEDILQTAERRLGAELATWLTTPAPGLQGLTPREVVLAGEAEALRPLLREGRAACATPASTRRATAAA